MSDGVLYSNQEGSWVAQLARAANAEFTQPLVSGAPTGSAAFSGGGCTAPIAAPLLLAVRFGGRPLAQPDSSCSPLLPGIALPTNNVAIDGARAYDALFITPDSAIRRGSSRAGGKLYARVLAPRQTQVTAMMAQDPTFVSVELGANEVLGAQSGLVAPGATVVPLETFRPIYDAIIDSVRKTGARAVIAGLGIADVSTFPSVRRVSELVADSAAFLRYNIVFAADCSGPDRDNLVQVGQRLAPAILGAAVAARAGLRFTFSCANVANAADGVITPAEAAAVNAITTQLAAYIRGKAEQGGYAFFELGELYATSKLGQPFSLDRLLTSVQPYGPLISLDGVHPTRAGHTVLARAAARAINARYRLGIVVPDGATAP